MGLTAHSSGYQAQKEALPIRKRTETGHVIALAGNPNVGKSTVFNALTGLRQHTGNWPGKTVSCAEGTYSYKDRKHILVDLPGCYSLSSGSEEEKIAQQFLASGIQDLTVVVCDAGCLARSMKLLFEIAEITPKVLLCVNLLDEARKLHLELDLEELELRLGVPVVGISAGKKEGLSALCERIWEAADSPIKMRPLPYPKVVVSCLNALSSLSPGMTRRELFSLLEDIYAFSPDRSRSLCEEEEVYLAIRKTLSVHYPTLSSFRDMQASVRHKAAELMCRGVAKGRDEKKQEKRYRLDRLLAKRWVSLPLMLFLLAGVFFITIKGANLPSEALKTLLFSLESPFYAACSFIGLPEVLCEMLVFGIYRTLAWIVAVMLPPMAIFFPMFTFLEDLGLLPRIAFSMEHTFRKCGSCGKGALTMCMGLGCNAAGVTGCRIIDSPREKLLSILTNSFVPCNGRFPQPSGNKCKIHF